MHFFIEQIAIAPSDPAKAKELLDAIRATQDAWAEDHVTATGTVLGTGATNEANLSFCYDMGPKEKLEFEVLEYTEGRNWLGKHVGGCSVLSHLGMHCSAKDLVAWKMFFAKRNIRIAQEVRTISHTNPNIKHSRRYQYVIFDTFEILGVDLKFIVRLPAPQEVGL